MARGEPVFRCWTPTDRSSWFVTEIAEYEWMKKMDSADSLPVTVRAGRCELLHRDHGKSFAPDPDPGAMST